MCYRYIYWYLNTCTIVIWFHQYILTILYYTGICAAEMAVRYAALSACRKVHVCRCNSLGGAT